MSKLVQVKTGTPIHVGQKVETFRHEIVTVESWSNTRNRVYCIDARGNSNEWFPSVIGAELIED